MAPDHARLEEDYFRRFTDVQLSWVTEIHMFVSQAWLEDGGLDKLCKLDCLKNIEHVRITVRYCDWRDVEDGPERLGRV